MLRAPGPPDKNWDFDRWASTYDEVVGSAAPDDWMYGRYGQLLDLVVRRANLSPGQAALDVGTGTGNLAARLLGSGASVTAVDPSPGMLERARQKLGPGARFVQADFLSLPADLGRFAAVTSTYALHHLPEPEQVAALGQLHARLLPGGGLCWVT